MPLFLFYFRVPGFAAFSQCAASAFKVTCFIHYNSHLWTVCSRTRVSPRVVILGIPVCIKKLSSVRFNRNMESRQVRLVKQRTLSLPSPLPSSQCHSLQKQPLVTLATVLVQSQRLLLPPRRIKVSALSVVFPLTHYFLAVQGPDAHRFATYVPHHHLELPRARTVPTLLM